MHCSTVMSLSQAAVMYMAMLALFTSVCMGVPASGSSAIRPRAYCAPGQNYTVVPRDTCQTIAEKHSVSTNDIIALNCLNPQCTNLKANATIQLPGCCDTYTVNQGDDCTSIASTRNLTLADFYAFNPTLQSNCSQLFSGGNVCLTAPQGTPFNPPLCPAQSSTSSASANTAQPSLAPGTSPTCLPLLVAKTGDTCDSIASGGNVPHFKQINPSINYNCTNLIPGVEYCVSPP